ncbi:AAA family ATPase [Aliarcobacter skirrowii]|uniref:AAA family ATPase n=1 Tax=Aliarcobacter skirrowii TaxID=28200 RepID=UPI0021B41E44|nr:AAA family ATPase [Aliarcobacter skirrowii]MCT7447424.1 AAA family ATPase [Aliarcobacter skirrowii]
MPEDNTTNINNIEDSKVHYHLSANVKFDKDYAFNGTTNPGGSYNNPNIEKSVEIEDKDGQKFINSNKNPTIIEKLNNINNNIINIDNRLYTIKRLRTNNFKISDYIDNTDNTDNGNFEEYFFSEKSKDNKKNIDKTFAGITYNIFAKNQTVNDKKIQQFYHGGSISGYSQDLIQEKKSFTLFYTRENIPDLNNENSLLIGLGEIQNKIGVLDTNDEKRKGKIYCYDHYEKKEKTEKYHLFRFPYQELIDIANNGNNDSAKQFLEELIEPLSIENSDKPFFSKGQSTLISTYIVLKYANRLYEQIMKLKQNENLWKAVQKASKQDPQTENSKAKWHFCDDVSIRFLKLSIEKLKEAQLKQKNPGLWALKDYFQINSGDKKKYENFLKMCAGEKDYNPNDLVLFNADEENIKIFINLLINYPIYNKKTIQRIFTHLGLKAVYTKQNDSQDISTDLSELIINGKKIKDLLDIVNENKKIESDDNLFNNTNEGKQDEINKYLYKKDEINKYLYKNGFCEIGKFNKDGETIKLKKFSNYKIQIKDQDLKEILSLDDFNNNPYLLFEKYIQNDDAPLLLDDIDWGQKIIQKDTFEVDNKFRLRAIVVEYIKKQENQSGHVWVSYEDAQEYLNDRLYELDNELEKFYKISDFWDIEIFEYDNNKKFLTLKEFASREIYIKEVISGLIESSHLNSNKVLDKLKEAEQKNPENKFIESEKSLIKMKNLDFVFISGVAGSGKSHTLCKYLDYLAENKITNFQVLTPSGKAANVIKKKIEENKNDFNKIWNYLFKENNDKKIKNKKEKINNKEIELISKISTADRYIVDSGDFWNHRLFARVDDDSTPDEKIDVLIIDEISMITLDTLYYILKIKKPKKLIILGDIKQLPPIGYGSLATSIYNHLFLESSFQDICLAKMETSHRADDNSLFIKHSLTLRDKEKQLKEEELKDNIIEKPEEKDDEELEKELKDNIIEKPEEKDDEELEKELKKKLNEALNKYKKKLEENNNFILIPYSKTIGTIIEDIYNIEGKKPTFLENIKKMNKNIQILTPNRIGESGTYAINNIFKTTLKKEKEGLKFIYNKNDKKTGLSNGTMGYYEIKNDKDIIDFDGVTVPYIENSENTNYELGFAITVHKSQGSGFPIVILVLPKQNNSLITKELIYTALTRPEQKMYILYHEDNIKALTHLPSIPHRNMNLFDRDKLLWIKDEIEYPITYNEIEYRRKQDLYFALMLEYSGFIVINDIKSEEKNVESNETKKENEEAKKIVVKYHKNGAFVWSEKVKEKEIEKLSMPKIYIKLQQDEESFKYLNSFVWSKKLEIKELLMPKFYIKEKQDEKSFKYLKSIDLQEVYKNFKLNIAGNNPKNRVNENKVDIIEDNNNSIEIITHNGLRTRSWSEAILMLIFDKLQIPYFYEVEIRREKHTNNEEINTYKLTYPNPTDNNYRIPDFTIVSGNGNFDKQENVAEIKNVQCIIEHLGMLSNEDYKKGWQNKVKNYYDKYKFNIVAPLNSLTHEINTNTYYISKKWNNEGNIVDNDKNFTNETRICFTTDEDDLKNIQTLVDQLNHLKEFLSLQ